MNELQIHTLLEQACRYQEEEKPLHAIQLLKQVIAASPTCGRAYVLLAQVYTETNRPDFAERILLDGLQANEDNPEYYFLLGNLQLSQLKFSRALPYFEKIRNLKAPQVHLRLGLTLMALGRLDEAEAEMKNAAALDPHLPRLHELWGELLLGQERVEEAVEMLQQAIRLDQYSGNGHRLLGEAFARLAQWQAAYDNLVAAVDLDPDDADAWSLCGDVLLHLNSFAEAKKYFQRALQLKPNNPGVLASYDRACALLADQDAL